MTSLTFRNLTVTPADPVEEWGVEGILAALDRGGADDWRKVVLAVAADPDGAVAADFEQAADAAESRGSVAAVRAAIAYLTASPHEVMLRRIRRAFRATEYTQAEAARRLGTSASRLSTYLSGKVVPSAEFHVRLEMLADRRIAEVTAIADAPAWL